MRRFAQVALLSAGLAVGGCASLIPTPVTLPEPDTIAGYFKNFDGNFPANATPADIVFVGVAYVDNNCEQFFEAVEQMQQRTSMAQKTVNVAGDQAIILIEKTARATANAVTYVAVGKTIADALFEEFRKQYLFAPHSSAVRRMVMVASERQARDIRIVSSQPGFTRAAAIFAVQTYAKNCTLANIMALYRQAIEKGADRIAADAGAALLPTGGSGGRESVGEVRRSGRGSTGGTGLLGINRYVVR